MGIAGDSLGKFRAEKLREVPHIAVIVRLFPECAVGAADRLVSVRHADVTRMQGRFFSSCGMIFGSCASGLCADISMKLSQVVRIMLTYSSENARRWSLSTMSTYPVRSMAYSSSWLPYSTATETSGYLAENSSSAR